MAEWQIDRHALSFTKKQFGGESGHLIGKRTPKDVEKAKKVAFDNLNKKKFVVSAFFFDKANAHEEGLDEFRKAYEKARVSTDPKELGRPSTILFSGSWLKYKMAKNLIAEGKVGKVIDLYARTDFGQTMQPPKQEPGVSRDHYYLSQGIMLLVEHGELDAAAELCSKAHAFESGSELMEEHGRPDLAKLLKKKEPLSLEPRRD